MAIDGSRKVMARVFKPECRVRFYTTEGIINASSRSRVNKEGFSIEDDVISVMTNVDLATDSGTFQITLSSRNRWDKVLASNDLVYIYMNRRKELDILTDGCVFVGLVDDIRKSAEVQESSIHRTITVVGRNFAKCFLNFTIGAIDGYAPDSYWGTTGWFGEDITFDGGNAVNNMKAFLDGRLFKKMNYTFSDGRKLNDILKTKLTSRSGEKCASSTNFCTYSGSAWDFMREIVDEPFNQIYFDTDGGQPCMIIRETPFNEENWNELDRYVIDDSNIMSNDVGRSDIETYTFFQVLPTESTIDDASFVIEPVYYQPYLEKFGTKTLKRYTKYAGGAFDDSDDPIAHLKEYRDDLYNWNCMNARFWNGEITCVGDCYFHVGQRLLVKSIEDGRDIEYYIEGITHNFVNYRSWTTKLEVTRGLENSGADRFKEPWGKMIEYKPEEQGSAWFDYVVAESGMDKILDFISNVTGSITAEKVANLAKQWANKKTTYRLGSGRGSSDMNSCNNTYDCSSFVWHCFNACGVKLGEVSGATTKTLRNMGTAVTDGLRVGDAVYWNTIGDDSHIGIYVGKNEKGERMAVACNSNSGVKLFSMDSSYWKGVESNTKRRFC